MTPEQLLARWRDDPARFALEALGIRAWSRQREVFDAVRTYRRVAVRSGHKVSKSCTIGCLALWWVLTRPRAKVVLSSTVGEQLKNILWPELKRLHRGARFPLGGKLAEDYHGGLWFTDDRAVIALKSEDTKPESFAGISSPHLLYLIDEASGFPDALLEAAWGNTAAGGTIAAFSNPTRTSGWFFSAFHDKAASWHTIHIDSRESPNITGKEKAIPGLASPEWVHDTAKAFGADSPTFSVRVAGNFPKAGDQVVNGLGLIEAAVKRSNDPEGALRFGLDVGRTGDDPSMLAAVRGLHTYPLREVRHREGDELAGWVLAQLDELADEGVMERDEVVEVRIDVIGVGASAYDHLKVSERVVAIPVNVSTRPTDPEHYVTRRDEVWFAGQKFLSAGGDLPPDDTELHAELVGARYTFDGKSRYVVESKDSMKKRLKRSPNRADAWNLAVYEAPGLGDMEAAGELFEGVRVTARKQRGRDDDDADDPSDDEFRVMRRGR